MTETKKRKMSAAQRRARKRKIRNRRIAMTVALVLVVALVSVGGTIAWLTDQTNSVVNTFTVGDINITLTETWNTDKDGDGNNDSWSAKMVPGNTITKDPKVTVVEGSENCWLFVKVEKSSNLDTYIDYEMASGWTALGAAYPGVYYYNADIAQGTPISVLKDNKVKVIEGVTKAQMEALKASGATQPTLTFTAYACQKDNVATAEIAWAKITTPSA